MKMYLPPLERPAATERSIWGWLLLQAALLVGLYQLLTHQDQSVLMPYLMPAALLLSFAAILPQRPVILLLATMATGLTVVCLMHTLQPMPDNSLIDVARVVNLILVLISLAIAGLATSYEVEHNAFYSRLLATAYVVLAAVMPLWF